jgi:hypothetical protein
MQFTLRGAVSNKPVAAVPSKKRVGNRIALDWIEHVDGREIIHRSGPGVGFWCNLATRLLLFLPIEWLL